jgi:hypothetical protein
MDEPRPKEAGMVDEGREFTIVDETLVPRGDGPPTWVVTWKSIKDESLIRRRMTEDQYQASVSGPRDEKPLWRRQQIDPIGEPDVG